MASRVTHTIPAYQREPLLCRGIGEPITMNQQDVTEESQKYILVFSVGRVMKYVALYYIPVVGSRSPTGRQMHLRLIKVCLVCDG